jgi:hypothetical protein
MAEPDINGINRWSSSTSGGGDNATKGIPSASKQNVNASFDVNIPSMKELSKSIEQLIKGVSSLRTSMNQLADGSLTAKMVAQQRKLQEEYGKTASAATALGKASVPPKDGKTPNSFDGTTSRRSPKEIANPEIRTKPNVFEQAVGVGRAVSGYGEARRDGATATQAALSGLRAGDVAMGAPTYTATGGSGGSGSGSGGGGRGIGPGAADSAGGAATGAGLAGALDNFMKNITGQNGILNLLMSGFNGMAQAYGAIAGGGIQYAYNRINGPTGNQNTMLGLSQALGPNAGMMGMNVSRMVSGLAQQTPIMGSVSDITNTVLAGQSVGALMKGTPDRNGFFESVRQMQVLTPGAAPGSMAQAMAGYIGNTQSQQRGMYLGEGAFTMIGQGGRYKSLAEWAAGIMKFFKEQRPGGGQGAGFNKEELMAQNFPGSNINAWFQMMGVPQAMVDYWWQYALNTAGTDGPVTTDTLKRMVDSSRGMDLGYERLRTMTQSSRREYLMGENMFPLYGARESADRRFNVGMQGTDAALSSMFRGTNLGNMLALLPTPIMEMLMPILTSFATSPVGAGASAVGHLFGDPPIGDPIGDSGPRGATNTAHMSPDLAKKVGSMMRANPRLKISSGYRDTVTQNRLHRQGVGRVGPASKSKHTRGWAADLGPVSELGWVAQNAGKFGLQTASNYGEPWHVQVAGTMPVGDPLSWAGNVVGAVGGAVGGAIGGAVSTSWDAVNSAKDFVMDPLTGIASELFKGLAGLAQSFLGKLLGRIQSLIGGFIKSGTLSDMLDGATGLFSRMMTAPLAGLAKLFGGSNFSDDDYDSLRNNTNTVTIPVSTFSGFMPESSRGGGTIFGDPPIGDPVGDYMSMASPAGALVGAGVGGGKTVILKAEINLNGGALTYSDARRAASTMADAWEEEAAKRDWRNY